MANSVFIKDVPDSLKEFEAGVVEGAGEDGRGISLSGTGCSGKVIFFPRIFIMLPPAEVSSFHKPDTKTFSFFFFDLLILIFVCRER